MALSLILENALNQLEQRGVILIYNNTKRAIHSGGSFISRLYTLHLTLCDSWDTTALATYVDNNKCAFYVVLRLHLPLSGSLLEATFAKCSPYFKGENYAGCALALSDQLYLRTPPCSFEQFPRSYGRIMQPICNKIALESKLSRDFVANVHFLLYLCTVFGKLLKRRRIQLYPMDNTTR